MHGGYLQKKQPVYIKPVDSVRSLNEIALRDAEVWSPTHFSPDLLLHYAYFLHMPLCPCRPFVINPRCLSFREQELQVMLKRQAQQPIQNSYPPMENQSYYPIPQGSYAPQATTQGSFGSMAHPGAMPNSYSVPPLQQQPNSYSMLHQHGYHQENFYPGQQEYGHKQERSFSLHTAPMPAVNEGEYQELYETPLNKQAQHIPFHGVPSVKMAPDLPVPDTVGPYGRNFAQDALEQTAFQGDYSYDEPTIPITKERATFQRTAPPPPTWNAAPAPMHMSLSAGGELCDYVPTQTARQKPPLAAVAPAPPLVPPSPAKVLGSHVYNSQMLACEILL